MNDDPLGINTWLRASSVARWSECPRSAHQYVDRPGRHVAAVVGTLTHAILSGEKEVDLPSEIHYDMRITPTLQDARQQAMVLASNIKRLIAKEEINITEHELFLEAPDLMINGHVDMIGTKDGANILLDVKTGRSVGHGWLQMGAYAALLEHVRKWTPVFAAIVHAPRAKVRNIKPPTIQYRNAEMLMTDFRDWMYWHDKLHEHGLQNVAMPGMHCRWCHVKQCAVRMD